MLSKDFESGILKLEQKLEGTLTVAEGIAIKRFEIVTSVPIVPAVATVVPAVAVAEPAFIEQMYKKIKLTQELVKQRSTQVNIAVLIMLDLLQTGVSVYLVNVS